MKKRRLSIVVPLYNEEEVLESFYKDLLLPNLKDGRYTYELVFVDDGSTDKTAAIAEGLTNKDLLKVLSFSRNFGKEVALTAGLREATGDAVIMLDADGQHPPRYINQFIKKWEAGNQVVIGVRSQYNRKHGLVARAGSRIFYKMMGGMGDNVVVPSSMDYCLIDRVVVDEFNRLPEHNRITRGLLAWLGFKRDFVEIECNDRLAGKPSYNFKKLFNLALDSFASMSMVPLAIFGYIGFGITLLSGLLGLFVIIEQFLMNDPLKINFTGAACLSVFVTFLIGLVLISQSVTALYVAHIHKETQGRPLYIIDKKKSKNLKK